MSNQPFVIERTFNAPTDKVWAAITDNEQMKQWYFDLPDFEAVVGFEFQFLAGEAGKEYLHLCCVTEVEAGSKLAYTWRYEGFPGDSLVTFELKPEGDKTHLILTHSGLETLAPGHADFAAKNFEAGWTHFMDTALKNYLEGVAE